MKWTALFIIMLSAAGIQAQSPNKSTNLEFYSATIIVRDLKSSAGWYRKFLKFKAKEYKPNKYVKMQKDSFKLVLKQGKNTLLFSQIRLPKGKKYVHGFSKIGFITNQIDSLYQYYQRYDLNLYEGIVYDPNLKKKYFVVADVDGNKIQILEEKNDSPKIEIQPRFFTIISSDYLRSIKWYKENLGFDDLEIVDRSNINFQNLLINDNIILEVLHMPFESLEITEFMDVGRDLAGFDELKFRLSNGTKSSFQMDNNGNKIQLLK